MVPMGAKVGGGDGEVGRSASLPTEAWREGRGWWLMMLSRGGWW